MLLAFFSLFAFQNKKLGVASFDILEKRSLFFGKMRLCGISRKLKIETKAVEKLLKSSFANWDCRIFERRLNRLETLKIYFTRTVEGNWGL